MNPAVTQLAGATNTSATSATGSVAGMFTNPADELDDELEERRRRAMAAGQVGIPGTAGGPGTGKISTMMGYTGMATGNPLNLLPYGR